MMLLAQAEVAGRIATTASDRLFEYGGLGVIVVILFALIFGGLYVFGRYLMPTMMAKWNTDLLWYQSALQRQDDAYQKSRKEQTDAFLDALDHVTTRFTEDLKGLRGDFRDEMKAIVAVIHERFAEVNGKLDRLAGRANDTPRRTGNEQSDRGG